MARYSDTTNRKGMIQIDINCDMGEWTAEAISNRDAVSHHLRETDEVIMPFISSANIACGGHAGDTASMERTILLARKYGVKVGAHPSYPDRKGFGRRPLKISRDELHASVFGQIDAIKRLTESLGGQLKHVKPHGALYNEASGDVSLAALIVACVKEIDPRLTIYGLPGSETEKAAHSAGLHFSREAFADRAYQDDGSLLPRHLPGAVLDQVEIILERVLRMIRGGFVESVNGKRIPIRADTICVHGDNPVAPELVRLLNKKLCEAGIRMPRGMLE